GLMDDIEMLWRPRASESGLQFSTRLDARPDLWVMGDSVRLKQIVNNLVGNALKFTPAGRVEVRLAAREDGGAIVVSGAVEDTGHGIAHRQLGWVMHAF